jgi:hypothetical protein
MPKVIPFLTALLLLLVFPASGMGQGRGDVLNEQEGIRVREAQEIDWRVEVFLKIAERRLDAVAGVTPKPSKKEEEQWGPAPTGTQEQLLRAYVQIIDELETKIDDAHERNPGNPKMKKAMEKLLKAAEANLVRLQQLADTVSGRGAQTALEAAYDITRHAKDGATEYLAREPSTGKPKTN